MIKSVRIVTGDDGLPLAVELDGERVNNVSRVVVDASAGHLVEVSIVVLTMAVQIDKGKIEIVEQEIKS